MKLAANPKLGLQFLSCDAGRTRHEVDSTPSRGTNGEKIDEIQRDFRSAAVGQTPKKGGEETDEQG